MSPDPNDLARRLVDTAPDLVSSLDAAIERLHEPQRHWWHWVIPGLWRFQRWRFEKWRAAHRRDVAEADAMLARFYSEDEWGDPVEPPPPRTPHS